MTEAELRDLRPGTVVTIVGAHPLQRREGVARVVAGEMITIAVDGVKTLAHRTLVAIGRPTAVETLRLAYPHHVVLADWRARPSERKHKIVDSAPASWSDGADTRTFGFERDYEADDFQVRWGGVRSNPI